MRNKEDYKVILGEYNMKDWIIFDEISTGGKYFIMMNINVLKTGFVSESEKLPVHLSN